MPAQQLAKKYQILKSILAWDKTFTIGKLLLVECLGVVLKLLSVVVLIYDASIHLELEWSFITNLHSRHDTALKKFFADR